MQSASKADLCAGEGQVPVPSFGPNDELGLGRAYGELLGRMWLNPWQLWRLSFERGVDFLRLGRYMQMRMLGLPAEAPFAPAHADKRFTHDMWSKSPYFDFIKQSYLMGARQMMDAVERTHGLDEKTRAKLAFFTQQYINALSPTNFALSNPDVIEETIRTGGRNLVTGFEHFMRDVDWKTGKLRVKMTDTDSFELGKNLATTPGKVVFQNDLIQLIQYEPTTKTVAERPLLFVPPWINKYYILDLNEKKSIVKWATDQGHTVFVISWVNPDASLSQKAFDSYVEEGILAAVDAICRQTGEPSLNAVGYCIGGTLLGTTLAYMAAKGDNRIASATFFTSMLDFEEPGDLGVFIDEGIVGNLEKKMFQRGFLEGSEMAGTFSMMRSNDLVWSFYVSNYLMGKNPPPFDVLYWNGDNTRMPFRMHAYYLRKMYLENLLREPNGLTILGTPIDLRDIKIPCYFISCAEDHIAPWKSTYAGAQLFAGPVRFVLGGSGHIAGIINPATSNKYGYSLNDELPDDPEDWLANASRHEGSWWNDWKAWLTQHDGEQVPARDPSAGPLTVVEAAPGSFVTRKI